jgi:hypothetical protein
MCPKTGRQRRGWSLSQKGGRLRKSPRLLGGRGGDDRSLSGTRSTVDTPGVTLQQYAPGATATTVHARNITLKVYPGAPFNRTIGTLTITAHHYNEYTPPSFTLPYVALHSQFSVLLDLSSKHIYLRPLYKVGLTNTEKISNVSYIRQLL